MSANTPNVAIGTSLPSTTPSTDCPKNYTAQVLSRTPAEYSRCQLLANRGLSDIAK
jgi:hypothetical protein